MIFEMAILFYQLMAAIVGFATFLLHIKDLPNQKKIEAIFLGLFPALLSAIIWPIVVLNVFQNSDWKFKNFCRTKLQLVLLLVFLLCTGYLFSENEVIQKYFLPKKYWTNRIEELNSAIQFNKRMIRGLSAYNFHTDQQEHDLLMQRHYLKENYRKLQEAKKKLKVSSNKK